MAPTWCPYEYHAWEGYKALSCQEHLYGAVKADRNYRASGSNEGISVGISRPCVILSLTKNKSMLSHNAIMRNVVNWYRQNVTKWCFYCGEHLHSGNRTKDHVVPKSKGGRKIVACCQRCNHLKSHMSVEEFRLKLYGRSTVEFYAEQRYRIERKATRHEH